jgi:hypothetical protein
MLARKLDAVAKEMEEEDFTRGVAFTLELDDSGHLEYVTFVNSGRPDNLMEGVKP